MNINKIQILLNNYENRCKVLSTHTEMIGRYLGGGRIQTRAKFEESETEVKGIGGLLESEAF